MKDFNLKDALAGKPVITRDGRPVKIAGCNEDRNSLLGWIYGEVNQWTGGGKSYKIDSTYDLFMAPNERKEWVVRINNGKILGPYIKESHAFIIQSCEGGTIHEITIHE